MADTLEPSAFEFLEHTADVKLRAYGQTYAALFANAARGLSAYIFREHTSRESSQLLSVEATGSDSAELLVDWLNRVLVLLLSKSVRIQDVTVMELDSTRIYAKLLVQAAKPTCDVKAATYHQVSVVEDAAANGPARWQGTVTLDL